MMKRLFPVEKYWYNAGGVMKSNNAAYVKANGQMYPVYRSYVVGQIPDYGEYSYIIDGDEDYMWFQDYSVADLSWGENDQYDGHSCNSAHSHRYSTTGLWTVIYRNFQGGRFYYGKFDYNRPCTDGSKPYEFDETWIPQITEILTPLPHFTDMYNADVPAVSVQDMYRGCSRLKKIPDFLFANNPQLLNFKNCFDGCYGAMGKAPRLWRTYPDADGTACFRGCEGLSNFSDIPSSWK
jgi:hypothetical protein